MRMGECRRILFTGAQGGVGTSFAASNTALALCRRGLRVLLVDLSPLHRTQDTLFDCAERVVYDLGDLACGRAAADRVLLELPQGSPGALFLLPAAFAAEEATDSRTLLGLLPDLLKKHEIDFLLVDAPATAATLQGADGYDLCCVLASAEEESARIAAHAAAGLSRFGAREVRLLLNRFSLEKRKISHQPTALELCELAGARPIGILPVATPMQHRKRVRPRGVPMLLQPTRRRDAALPAPRAFASLAARLTGEDVPLLSGITGRRARKSLLY